MPVQKMCACVRARVCACTCERALQGQSEVLLERASNWPFYRPFPGRTLCEDGSGPPGAWVIWGKNNCQSPHRRTKCSGQLLLNTKLKLEIMIRNVNMVLVPSCTMRANMQLFWLPTILCAADV